MGAQRKVKFDEAKREKHELDWIDRGLELASAYNISYIETSAKTGQNVQDAFQLLARYV